MMITPRRLMLGLLALAALAAGPALAQSVQEDFRACVNPFGASRQETIVARVITIDGRPSPATSAPLIAPKSAPSAMAAGGSSHIGQPAPASRPMSTPTAPNWEPIEMSICREMMTRAAPQALN